jgi:hypothetical protein
MPKDIRCQNRLVEEIIRVYSARFKVVPYKAIVKDHPRGLALEHHLRDENDITIVNRVGHKPIAI